MVIEIPEGLAMTTIKKNKLVDSWQKFENYPYTQALGDSWVSEGKTAVLQVPSAIIPEEYNYLLNPLHKDFKRIHLIAIEPFEFDGRIKQG